MNKKTNYFNYKLAGVAATLLLFGIIVLASVSAVSSQEKFGKTAYYLLHQIQYGILPGIILGFICFKLKMEKLKKISWVIILASLFLMILTFIPGLGITTGGAARWINCRVFTFQPSEFLKLAIIVYLSALLAKRRKKQGVKKDMIAILLPFSIVMIVVIGLLGIQSDLSTLGVIAFVSFAIYLCAETPFWHSPLMAAAGTGLLYVFIRFFPYRLERFMVFLDPMRDPMGKGYQIKQAMISVGSGGILGLGFGMSNQKFKFLPQTMSDSIFAIIAEETGLAGSCILIILFLLFFWFGIKAAKASNDKFSQLCAIGISSWICIQAFINIGAMIRIIPLTGIPLPFIGYGGSHIVIELMALGILLNVGKSQKK